MDLGLRRVHIVGVCGTLMGAFAAFLRRQGVEVTGSDQNVYPPMSDVLREAGVRLLEGFKPEHLKVDGLTPDLIVIGNVVSAGNPEAMAAKELGLPFTSLPEFMEKYLLVRTRNLVVAGTHGKTTTSSLLAHVLTRVGRDPSYFIGGVSLDLPVSFSVGGRFPVGEFVLEGDEYDTAYWDKVPKFNHYLPDDVILTSVEYDHADIYPDLGAVVRAFEGLMDRVRPGGHVIACIDDEDVRRVVKRAKMPVLTYSGKSDAHARFLVRDAVTDEEGTHFVLEDRERHSSVSIQLPIPGLHNALNASAVWIQCQNLGIDSARVVDALKSFRGVKRRQEVRGVVRGVRVIDDFAHHPTAVSVTLEALRKKYPEGRMLVAFEPRSATSRRKVFQEQYARAFDSADFVLISVPYDQSRIVENDRFSGEQLVADLSSRGRKTELIHSAEEGVSRLLSLSAPGDTIAVLSNGGFGGLIDKLLKSE